MEKKWYEHRVAAGFVGALSLCILRSLGAGFYLGQRHEVVTGALLVLVSYILLAVFYCLYHLKEDSTKRDAFISGFLAPSILIALFNSNYQPNSDHTPPDSLTNVQEVGILQPLMDQILPRAYANEVEQKPEANPVAVIDSNNLKPSVVDGMRLELYRAPVEKQYVYILAKGKDLDKVKEVAKKISNLIQNKYEISVIKGKDESYVSLGSAGSISAVSEQKYKFRETAAVNQKNDPASSETYVKYVENAQLIEVKDLLKASGRPKK